MKQKVSVKPSYAILVLVIAPIIIFCLYLGIRLMTMPTTIMEPEFDFFSRLSIAIFPLAFGIFLLGPMMLVVMYLVNFEMSYDDDEVRIVTYTGENINFKWEEITGKRIISFARMAIVLKSGRVINLKYNYLHNIVAFWDAYHVHVKSA